MIGSAKSVIIFIGCAAFTDIANSSFGLSYWVAYPVAALFLFLAGYTAHRMRNGKGRV